MAKLEFEKKNIEKGVGYAVVYKLLENIFNNIHISLKYEDLYDAKTRLKELFDLYNKGESNIGVLVYEEIKDLDARLTTSLVYQKLSDSRKIILGQGCASLKADAQQRAAAFGIIKMNNMGYVKQVPHIYIDLCNCYM